MLHIDILEKSVIRFTLSLEDRIFYAVYITSDVGEVIGKIQERIADKDLDRIFQSVQEFFVLFENNLLFVAVFEIKVYSIDPEDSPESSIFHDDRIVPDFRYRQHRLRIEEIFVFLLLDFVFFSHIQEHQIGRKNKTIERPLYRY